MNQNVGCGYVLVSTQDWAHVVVEDLTCLPYCDDTAVSGAAGSGGPSLVGTMTGSPAVGNPRGSFPMIPPSVLTATQQQHGEAPVDVLRSVWAEHASAASLVLDRTDLSHLWWAMREDGQAPETAFAQAYEAKIGVLHRVLASVGQLLKAVPSSGVLLHHASPTHCAGQTHSLAETTATMWMTVLCALGSDNVETSCAIFDYITTHLTALTSLLSLCDPISGSPMGAISKFLQSVAEKHPSLVCAARVLQMHLGLLHRDPLAEISLAAGLQGVVSLLASKQLPETLPQKAIKALLGEVRCKLETAPAFRACRPTSAQVYRTRVRFTGGIPTHTSRLLSCVGGLKGNTKRLLMGGHGIGLVECNVVPVATHDIRAALSVEKVDAAWKGAAVVGDGRSPYASHNVPTLVMLEGDTYQVMCTSRSSGSSSAITVVVSSLEIPQDGSKKFAEVVIDDTEYRIDLADRVVAPWMYRRKISFCGTTAGDALLVVTAYNPLQMRRSGLVTLTKVPTAALLDAIANNSALRFALTPLNTTPLKRIIGVPPTKPFIPVFSRSTCLNIGKYLHGGALAALQLTCISTDFTIEMWLNITNIDEPRQFYYHGERDTSDVYAEVSPTESGVFWKIERRAAGCATLAATHEVPGRSQALNTWVHFTATFSANGWIMYLDGIAVATSIPVPVQETATKLSHPHCIWSVGKSFIGNIAEFRVWSVCRNAEAIQRDMRRRLTGAESGLVLLYPLDEGHGHTVHDNGPLGIHGLLEEPIIAQWSSVMTHDGIPSITHPCRSGVTVTRDVLEFGFTISGNSIVGADNFTCCPIGRRQMGVWLHPPEGAYNLPKGSHFLVYNIETGYLLSDQWLQLPTEADGAAVAMHASGWYDEGLNAMWWPFLAESGGPPPTGGLTLCVARYDNVNPTDEDMSVLPQGEDVLALASAVSALTSRAFEGRRELDVIGGSTPPYAIMEVVPLLCDAVQCAHEARLASLCPTLLRLLKLALRYSSIEGAVPPQFLNLTRLLLEEGENVSRDAVYDVLVAGLSHCQDNSQIMKSIIDMTSRLDVLTEHDHLHLSALLGVAQDLRTVAASLHAQPLMVSEMFTVLLRALQEPLSPHKRVLTNATNVLFALQKLLCSMCQAESHQQQPSSLKTATVDVKRSKNNHTVEDITSKMTIALCTAVLESAEKVLLKACQQIRQKPPRAEVEAVLLGTERNVVGTLLPFLAHALPLLHFSIIVTAVTPLSKLLAAVDDLIGFVSQLPFAMDVSWWRTLLSMIMYSAARMAVSMYAQGTSGTAAEGPNSIQAWLGTTLFSGGFTGDPTQRQALVRSIIHGTDTVSTRVWENYHGELEQCQRSILGAFMNVLATDAEVSQYDDTSKWISEVGKLSMYLRQVRQEESLEGSAQTLKQIIERAKLLCRLEPCQSTAAEDTARNKLGSATTKPRGKMQNWKKVFQSWKALKKVQALMHMRRTTSGCEESVQTQMIRFLKSDVDAAALLQAMTARRDLSVQRCTGVHFFTELLCENDSRECIVDVLRLISQTLRKKHYLADLLACGGESAGRVQAAVHQLLAQILERLQSSKTSVDPTLQILYLRCLDLPWQPADYTSLLRFDLPRILMNIVQTKTPPPPPKLRNYVATAKCPPPVKVQPDQLTVRCVTGTGSARGAELWSQSKPTQRAYYYEVTIVDLKPGYTISVGLGTKSYNLLRHPGWEEGSVGYHGDDGMVYHESGTGALQGPAFGLGYTIGCALLPDTHEVFFTRNGKLTALRVHNYIHDCYPMVGIDHGIVRFNFGAQPFKFAMPLPQLGLTSPQGNPEACAWKIFCTLSLRISLQVSSLLQTKPIPPEDHAVTMMCRMFTVLQQQLVNLREDPEASEIALLTLFTPLGLMLQALCVPNLRLSPTLKAHVCLLLTDVLSVVLLFAGKVRKYGLRIVKALITHLHPHEADQSLRQAYQVIATLMSGTIFKSPPSQTLVELLFHYGAGVIRLVDKEHLVEITSTGDRSQSYDHYTSFFGWEGIQILRYLYFSSDVTHAAEYRLAVGILFSKALSLTTIRNSIGIPAEALTALCVLHGMRDPPAIGGTVTFGINTPHFKLYDGPLQLVDYSVTSGVAEVVTSHFEERYVVSINCMKFTNAQERFDNLTVANTGRRASMVVQSEVDPILLLLKELLSDVRDQMTYVWWCLVTRLLRSLNYYLQFSSVRLRVVQLNLLPQILSMCQHVNQSPDQLWVQASLRAGGNAGAVDQLEECEHQLGSLLWTFPSRLPSIVSLQPQLSLVGRRQSLRNNESNTITNSQAPLSQVARRDGTPLGNRVMDDDAMQVAQDLSLHGFPIEMCVVALEHTNYNRVEALRFLTEHPDLDALLYEHGYTPMEADAAGDDMMEADPDNAEEEEFEEVSTDEDSDAPDRPSGGGYLSMSAHPDGTSVVPDTPPSPKVGMSSIVMESVENGVYFSGGRVAFPGCPPGPDLQQVAIDISVRLSSLALAASQVIFAHGTEDGRLTLQVVDGNVVLGVRVDKKHEVICKAPYGVESIGKVCHITLLGDCGSWTMYKDGAQVAMGDRVTTQSRMFHDSWCLGSLLDGGSPFYGEVTEFQAWASLLDSSQVDALSRGDILSSISTQVLHFRFDEGSGASAQNSIHSARWAIAGELVGSVEWLQSRSHPGNCFTVVMETELSSLHDIENNQQEAAGNVTGEIDKYDLWRHYSNMPAQEIGETMQDTCRMLAVQYACSAAKQVLSAWPPQMTLSVNSIGGAVNLCKLIRVTCDDERAETLPLLKQTLTAIIGNQPVPQASMLVSVFVEEFLSLLADEPKIVLYESRHPFTEAEMAVVHEVNNPGYNHYTVWFDPRCSLLQGHHQLTFYSDADLTQVIARYGGNGNNYASTLHIHSSRFFFDFKGDCGSNFWGYRIFVQYSGERFALGLEFIEQLIMFCNMKADESVGHAVRTRRAFNALVQAACRSTGRFRRKACAVLRQLLQAPELFLECERPDVSVLNDLRACLERQYRRETDTPLHSKFVQAVTEMFVAVKDAELIWRPQVADTSFQVSSLFSPDAEKHEDLEEKASFLAKRTQVRRFYSPEYRVGKERVSVERVGPDYGRIDVNSTDKCVMVWSEYLGCTVKADVALFRGKWYFEVKLLSGGDANIGFVSSAYISGLIGQVPNSWSFNGKKQIAMLSGRNAVFPSNAPRGNTSARYLNVRRWKAKDVVGVAIDADAEEIHYYLNGVALGTITMKDGPSGGNQQDSTLEQAINSASTNWAAAYNMSPTVASAARNREVHPAFQSPLHAELGASQGVSPVGYIPAISLSADEGVTINFGSTYFEHEPPASFYAVDVANFGMGSLLPFNQVRAFVDVSNALVHNKPLPPFFHDEIDHFMSDDTREGPASVGVLADDGVVSNGLEVRNSGVAFNGAHAECKVRGGRWYFEVTLNSQGLMQIGWITSSYEGNAAKGRGVGDDEHSWGIDLYRKLKWHNGISSTVGCARRWNVGDVIGCAIDVDAREMQFSVNGRWLVDAQGSDVLFRGFAIAGGFIPAVTLRANNNCVFNFGATALKYKPEKFKALGVQDTWLERVDLFYSTATAKDVKRRLALSSMLIASHMQTRSAPQTRSIELGIVTLVDEMYVRYHKTIHQLSFVNMQTDCVLHDDLIAAYPELTGVSRVDLQHRFSILKNVNKLFVSVFPTIHFDASSLKNPCSIAQSVIAFRGYVFRAVRAELVKSITKATNGRGEHVKITVNRVMAARHRQNPTEDPEGRRSLFGQTHSLLSSVHSRMFRTSQRFWSVVFAGEGAEDVGGPFREHIAEMCHELMSGALPLFVPTPNNRHNTGKSRECYFPSQKATSSYYMSMFRFLGQLMGGAMRSAEPLGLYLPSIVWKRLVRQPVDISDLEAVDHLCVQCIRNVRHIEREGVAHEAFDAMFETETFTTEFCDGSVVELVEGGQTTSLTFQRREEYCDLVLRHRLNEAEQQIGALRAGLVTVIPEYLLALMTWEDIEFRVCGQPDFTVQELMNSTTYEGISKDDRRVQYLWQVLDSATPTDRRNFLKFVSGRERLPVRLRIMAMNPPNSPNGLSQTTQNNEAGGPPPVDTYLPKAATCFFALELPLYSSVEVMREKLLYAITHCGDMDTDFRAVEQDEMEAPHMALEPPMDSDLGLHFDDRGVGPTSNENDRDDV